MNYMMNSFSMGSFGVLSGPILLLLVWSLFWKGLALWHSSRHSSPYWFIALLILNTFGIIEIIYLFFVLKIKFDDLFKLK